MTKTIKSVSFNDKNEEDIKMLKHIARRNFSGYVKKLIMADIKLKEQKKAAEQNKNPPIERRVEGKSVTKEIKPTKPFIPKQ